MKVYMRYYVGVTFIDKFACKRTMAPIWISQQFFFWNLDLELKQQLAKKQL